MSEPQEHNGEQGKTVLIFNVLSVCYVSGTVQSTWHVLTVSILRTVLWQKVTIIAQSTPIVNEQPEQQEGRSCTGLPWFASPSCSVHHILHRGASVLTHASSPWHPVGFKATENLTWRPQGGRKGPEPLPAKSCNWLHPSTSVLKAQPLASLGKEGHSRLLPRRTMCPSSGGFGEEMATHSSILAWKIPWMEEPGRLQSMESQRVRLTDWLHFYFISICSRLGLLIRLGCVQGLHSLILPWVGWG